jgi:hypothetical protein
VHNSLVCLALLNYGNDDQKIATCVRWRPVNCWGHSA